ncbi:RNA polymerase sigma factor [Nannocystaceae bacterium ST9]
MAEFPGDDTIRSLSRELLVYLRRKIPPDTDARDFVGEVWVRAADREPRVGIRALCFGIANRMIAQLYRERRGPRQRGHTVDDATLAAMASQGTGPATAMIRSEEREALQAALHSIPEVYREVVALSLAGLDNFEIAEKLALEYHTVRSRLSRGLAKLRAEVAASKLIVDTN